jgi:hypothetical protein
LRQSIVKDLARQKQILHHTRRLREMGADEQAIKVLTGQMLASPAHEGAREQIPQSPPARCEPQTKRPLARGVLGFRIRTAPQKEYSTEKDPSTGAPSRGRPQAKTKCKPKTES